jgi:LemA protein
LLSASLAAALMAILLLWLIATYNRLVRTRNRTREAWAGIDVQLQRRADLVPNLVRTVEGYRVHERDVLIEVTEARSRVAAAAGPHEAGRADERLERALASLYAVAEDYPDLRASENFLALQRELAELEEEISFARRYYNALAERLNTAIQSFPTVLVAGLLGFSQAEYFKAEPGARTAPAAEFGG